MVDILVYVFAYLLYSALGAFFIGTAVGNFKANRYFLFGFDLMVAGYNLAWILKLVFEH